MWVSQRARSIAVIGSFYSREVVILGTGVVLDTERYSDGGGITRIRLPQNSELSIWQRDLDVRQIAMAEGSSASVVRAPVSAGGGGDSPLLEDGT